MSGETDRRQATATPCTSRAGELVVLQLIWRGKTTLCLPHLTDAARERANALGIYNEFAEKKCQTSRTWGTLLDKVAAWAVRRFQVPPGLPCLLVVDNVSSHSRDGLQKVGQSEQLFMDGTRGLYVYFGLPGTFFQSGFVPGPPTGLSHCCNSGDQNVNSSLRQVFPLFQCLFSPSLSHSTSEEAQR
jgi:hypothetical protein